MEREKMILGLIILIVLASRLLIVYQVPSFQHDGYSELRQIENIRDHGIPIIEDSLRSGDAIITPGFHYLMALFSMVFSITTVAKVVPQFFSASMILFIFLIALEMTRSKKISLFTAFISGFVPIFYFDTINNISPFTLAFPLMLAALYCFMRLEDKKYRYSCIILSIMLPFVSPSAIVFVLGLVIYLFLAKVEGQKILRIEIETILFISLFVVWSLLLMYKKAFLEYGGGIVYQNIPASILDVYFTQITPIQYVAFIGLIPLFFGLATTYKYIFSTKHKTIYILIGFAVSSFLLLYFKFIQPTTGLMMLGIILTILSAQYFKDLALYLEKTLAAPYKKFLFLFFIGFFAITSIISSVSFGLEEVARAPSPNMISAYTWLAQNSAEDSVVVAPINDGHLITALAKKSNVLDTSFLMTPDASRRLKDIEDFYTTPFEVEAVRILDRYGITHVIGSGIADFGERCFSKIYSSGIEIYQVKCQLEEQ